MFGIEALTMFGHPAVQVLFAVLVIAVIVWIIKAVMK